MTPASSTKRTRKFGKGVPIVLIVIGIIILLAAGYFFFSGKIGGQTGRGFEVNIDTGTDQISKAAEAATKIPDTNAFDQINPYGYKNPFE